jgi:hypothetical protein
MPAPFTPLAVAPRAIITAIEITRFHRGDWRADIRALEAVRARRRPK